MSTLEGTLGATKSENQEGLHITVKIEGDLKGYGRRLQREGCFLPIECRPHEEKYFLIVLFAAVSTVPSLVPGSEKENQ